MNLMRIGFQLPHPTPAGPTHPCGKHGKGHAVLRGGGPRHQHEVKGGATGHQHGVQRDAVAGLQLGGEARTRGPRGWQGTAVAGNLGSCMQGHNRAVRGAAATTTARATPASQPHQLDELAGLAAATAIVAGRQPCRGRPPVQELGEHHVVWAHILPARRRARRCKGWLGVAFSWGIGCMQWREAAREGEAGGLAALHRRRGELPAAAAGTWA